MKPLRWISRAWVLALILGVTGVSCATHKNAVLIKDGEHKQQADVSTLKEPNAATKVKGQTAYGKLSLHFEVNQGQTDKQVKFLYNNPLAPAAGERARVRGIDTEQPEQAVLRMRLVGANPSPQLVGLDELPGL